MFQSLQSLLGSSPLRPNLVSVIVDADRSTDGSFSGGSLMLALNMNLVSISLEADQSTLKTAQEGRSRMDAWKYWRHRCVVLW